MDRVSRRYAARAGRAPGTEIRGSSAFAAGPWAARRVSGVGMFENWSTIVFGWPAVITALLTFSVAVALSSRVVPVRHARRHGGCPGGPLIAAPLFCLAKDFLSRQSRK